VQWQNVKSIIHLEKPINPSSIRLRFFVSLPFSHILKATKINCMQQERKNSLFT
jgi:hypothetical protein